MAGPAAVCYTGLSSKKTETEENTMKNAMKDMMKGIALGILSVAAVIAGQMALAGVAGFQTAELAGGNGSGRPVLFPPLPLVPEAAGGESGKERVKNIRRTGSPPDFRVWACPLGGLRPPGRIHVPALFPGFRQRGGEAGPPRRASVMECAPWGARISGLFFFAQACYTGENQARGAGGGFL